MQKSISFKKKLIASAIASYAMAGFSGAVYAQDAAAAAEPVDEVIVSGIRASLKASMDIKRDSSGVVDAISAEDIGKMPDSNLAESLQRITGVSIDRANGEGFQVTARGFGPSYNLVTLNNRVMPASQIAGTGGLVPNRAFDMSNIASEGVSGVEVYKTGKANIASGGIGATINLKTLKPLDNPGLKFSVGVKALSDSTNRIGDDVTPEISGFGSWSDDMFGASLSFSHQERDSAQTGMYSNGWNASDAWAGSTTLLQTRGADAANAKITNGPADGQQVNQTRGLRYIHGDYERTRDNAQLTLQFRPTESITTTLDYTLAQQESFVNRAEMSFWFDDGSFPVKDVAFHNNGKVASPKYLWLENSTNNPVNGPTDPQGQKTSRDIGLTQSQGNVQNNLESLGVNVEFKVSDQLTLTLDAHDSSSESLPADGAMSNWFNIATGAQGVYAEGYDTSGDLPLLVGAYRDKYLNGADGSAVFGIRDGGDVVGQLDKADIGSTVRQVNYDRSTTDITQIQLNGRFEFNDESAIDFGVESRNMENLSRGSSSQILLEGGWNVATPGDVPANMIEELDFGKLFDGYSTTLSPESRKFFDAAGTEGKNAQVFTKGYIAKDAAQLGEFLSNNAQKASGNPDLAWAPNPNDGTNRRITEDVTSLFGQIDLKSELGDMPVDVLAGVRYEKTDVESNARIATSTIVWQGDNDFITNEGSAKDAPLVSKGASYHHVLPNLDIAVHVTDDVTTRVSMGKTIARANYNDLQQGVSGVRPPEGGPTILTGRPGPANDGNVGLLPIESNNFDLSVEWYYSESSYVSIGLFNKDVTNFIGISPIRAKSKGVLDPTNGPRAREALAAITAQGVATADPLQDLFRMMASLNSVPGGCINQVAANPICGQPFGSATYTEWENRADIVGVAGDPDLENLVNTPVNSKNARLTGWEFAVQHFFGETGFGTQANYTIVDGNVGFDLVSRSTQFALTGLSDSANLALIYEKDGWQARLVYNWRDKFLDNTAVAGNEPEFTEAYTQVDLTLGYKFNESFSVGFEGLNVLGEDKRQYGRSTNQLTRLEILGPRYALTGHYTF
jgi:TonB-dependent receptor